MNQPLVSIVTGAARGIGLGIALAMAKRGDRLVLVDVAFSDPSARSAVVRRVGNDTILKAVDITLADQVEALVADVLKRFGRIDCLVNSAGVNRPAPVCEVTESDWDMMLDVNLKGAFLLSREVAKPMIKQKSGRLVHIGSTASHTAAPGIVPYAASKHGLIGLVRGMACDLSPHGIMVNAVCPGNTETEMLERVLEQRAQAQGKTLVELKNDLARKTPAGRIGTPQDIAGAVLFLTSADAAYITGQMLTVDGGRSLNLM